MQYLIEFPFSNLRHVVKYFKPMPFTIYIPLSSKKYLCTAFHSDKFIREIPIITEKNSEDFQDSTYSEEEVKKFKVFAHSWWDPEGDLKPLHSLNKLRIAFIRDSMKQSKIKDDIKPGTPPLAGLRLLDVGCGGGILCEPLARLGAEIVGIDPIPENITAADAHAKGNKPKPLDIKYISSTIEEHLQNLDDLYDGVIASEVIEHVQNVDLFINSCVSCLKPGGSLFITTINKTMQSWLCAVIMAEYVLRLLPFGTHDWNKFISPDNLASILGSAGCSVRLLHGMAYIPGFNRWIWITDSSVNYAIHAVKNYG